jgi:hypothetical protein
MKKLSVIVLLFLLGVLLNAQNPAIDKLFDKYGETEGFTTVIVKGKLFDMISSLEDDEEVDPEINFMSKLTSIRILAMDECEKPEGINFYDEVMETLDDSGYEELLVVKEKDQDVKFLVKENDGIISELLLVVGGEDNALISILGDIDLKEAHRIAKEMHGDHMSHFSKLKDVEF